MLKILIENLTKYYGSKRVLNNLNLEINENDFFILLGRNASGKTTLVRILLKIVKPSYGSARVIFNGKELKRKEIGFILEDETPFDLFSPYEYLKFFSEMYSIKADIDEVLKKFGLYEDKNTKIFKLSKGNKKKLCIAKALIAKPKVLILDQPFEGLDLETKKEVYESLKNEQIGKIIFMTTHELDFVTDYSTHIGIINNGSFLGKFKTEEIKDKKITEFYFEKLNEKTN
ncbi:MAG: ABC transporter ATP-binding protein [Candidatus Hydrothermales bacterium]